MGAEKSAPTWALFWRCCRPWAPVLRQSRTELGVFASWIGFGGEICRFLCQRRQLHAVRSPKASGSSRSGSNETGTMRGRAGSLAAATATKRGKGAARGASAGISGGNRRTTRSPKFGGSVSERSPATPAANDKVLSTRAVLTTRMRFETFKPSRLTESRPERHATAGATLGKSSAAFRCPDLVPMPECARRRAERGGRRRRKDAASPTITTSARAGSK